MDKFMKLLITMLLAAFLTAFSMVSLAADGKIPNGKIMTYYEDGSKKADKQYKNGVPIGFWESWHKDGSPHTIINFLGDTGQIEKIEARYPSGALLFKGSAQIKESLKEKQEKYSTIKFGKGCKAIASKFNDGSQWYSNYELELYSFYEDGTCEQAVLDNMHRLIAQMYMRIYDITTGNVYDFPWNEMWGTVPSFIKKRGDDSK
jgi:hypothetical protein